MRLLKLNILYKFVGYLIIISVFPLLVFAISSYDLVRQTILGIASQYSLQVIGDHRDYLQLQMEQIQNLASRIASIEEIGTVAENADSGKARNAYDELTTQAKIRESLNIYSNLKGVVSIDLFTTRGHRFYVGDTLTVPPVDDSIRRGIYEKALASAKPILWLGVVNNLNTASTSRKVLTAVKILRNFSQKTQMSEPVGMLLINYSTDYLFEYFNSVDLGKNAYLIVADAQGNMIYAPDHSKIGQRMPAELSDMLKTRHDDGKFRFNAQDNLVVAVSLVTEPWQIIGIIPQATLLAPMKRLTLIAIALIVLCAIVIVFVSRHFRRNLITPVQAISDRFRRIQQQGIGHVEHLPAPYTKDEIGELVIWFNAFLDTLVVREQYKKELEDSQHKFSSIFQQAPMPLALVRLEGEFVDVNDFWLQQFGFERDDILGRTATELNIWVDPQNHIEMVEKARQEGLINRFEVQYRRKDGRCLICLLSGRPIRIQEQNLYILTPVDITSQRQAEQEILDINVQLESRVLSRTTRLEQANQELNRVLASLNAAQGELVRSEKLAALGSLVAGIAHEINTPVGVIVTGASVLNEASEAINKRVFSGIIRKSEILDYLQTVTESARLILSNANRAAHLIQSFKQVAVDQTSEQRREFELNEFIGGLITSLNPTLRKARATIELHSVEKIYMDSYPGLLAQVLTNLTMNAVTHGFSEVKEGKISIDVRLIGEMIAIEFEDNGVGIPEEFLDKIFDPFFTTRRGQGGTGLGLNIVFNIVSKQFGGTITVHSTPGEGAMFKIAMPRVTTQLVAHV